MRTPPVPVRASEVWPPSRGPRDRLAAVFLARGCVPGTAQVVRVPRVHACGASPVGARHIPGSRSPRPGNHGSAFGRPRFVCVFKTITSMASRTRAVLFSPSPRLLSGTATCPLALGCVSSAKTRSAREVSSLWDGFPRGSRAGSRERTGRLRRSVSLNLLRTRRSVSPRGWDPHSPRSPTQGPALPRPPQLRLGLPPSC